MTTHELAEEFRKWVGDGHWRANDLTWARFVIEVVIPRAYDEGFDDGETGVTDLGAGLREGD